MILSRTTKPVRVIGFKESTMTQEGVFWLRLEWKGTVEIINPNDFLESTNKEDYRYMVFFTLETELRKEVINVVNDLDLDCVTFIQETAIVYKDLSTLQYDDAIKIVGKGSVVHAHSIVALNSKIGNYCIVEAYCLVSHYVELGDNVILHSGTMIAGKTKIGAGSVFNFRSSALNNLSICNDVEIGAISNVTKDITKPGRYIGSIARYAGDVIQADV
jgi:carbonic anhydrase/acetyltransferase-like protein (isoleucine patch superfamily)